MPSHFTTFFELKKDPGICLTIADLGHLAGGCPYATMSARLSGGKSVEEAIAMGNASKAPRPCACGCGRTVTGKKKYYHPTKCRKNHYEKQKESGAMWPLNWGVCVICGRQFPRYKLYNGRKQEGTTCSGACAATLAGRIRKGNRGIQTCQYCHSALDPDSSSVYCDNGVCKSLAQQQKAKARYQKGKKKKTKPRVDQYQRSEICIRIINATQIICQNYKNWLKNPYQCHCTGFTIGEPS